MISRYWQGVKQMLFTRCGADYGNACMVMRASLILSLGLIVTLFCTTACSDVTSESADAVPVFDVNFVVMTTKYAVNKQVAVSQFQKEIDILNRYFVGKNGEHPVQFRLKGGHTIHELGDSSCAELLRQGDAAVEYNWRAWADMINSCPDHRVVDPHAINFFIYDSYIDKDGFKDETSHGRRNDNRPYIVLDWERLNHRTQSPEEHEMGHAFGLEHVCVGGAGLHTPTNIMASEECGRGSGGTRNIGFDSGQLETIRRRARDIQEKLNY